MNKLKEELRKKLEEARKYRASLVSSGAPMKWIRGCDQGIEKLEKKLLDAR